MIPTAPQIGFDRFIQLDWVASFPELGLINGFRKI